MSLRSPRFALVLAVPAALACGTEETTHPVKEAFAQAPPSTVSRTSVALRFPTTPGAGVRIYSLPGMQEAAWRFETPNVTADDLIGFAVDEDLIYSRSTEGILFALDLGTGRAHVIDTGVTVAAMGPTGIAHFVKADGAVGSVASRRAESWDSQLPGPPAGAWGTTSGRLVTLAQDADSTEFVLHTPTGRLASARLPTGTVVPTAWGDLVAVATDSGISTFRTRTGDPMGFAPLASPVGAMAFSTAGHRIFVATVSRDLIVLDRFSMTIVTRHRLPAAAEAIRPGPVGRFLALKPAEVDSAWIADTQDFSRLASVAGSWDPDLPAIGTDGTVVIRRGDDVVAVNPSTRSEEGRVAGGGADRWMLIAWDPRRPTLQLAEDEETGEEEEATGQLVFVQLSSTSSDVWAEDRAETLRQAGLRAQVLDPNEYYDRYRVVLGPYPNREDADNIARRLGQPYFLIFMRDTTATRVP